MVSRNCEEGYFNDGLICGSASFIATQFSSYSQPIPNLSICEGTVVSTRNVIQCSQVEDSRIVDVSFCASTPAGDLSHTEQSPMGDVFVSILNGLEIYSCATGSTTQVFSSRTCDLGYYDNGSSCIKNPILNLSLAKNLNSTCSLTTSGLVNCSGSSNSGSFTEDNSGDYVLLTPMRKGIIGSLSVLAISTGGNSSNAHSCAIASDRKLYCWGSNDSGQLGTGDLINSTLPTAVNATGPLSGKDSSCNWR